MIILYTSFCLSTIPLLFDDCVGLWWSVTLCSLKKLSITPQVKSGSALKDFGAPNLKSNVCIGSFPLFYRVVRHNQAHSILSPNVYDIAYFVVNVVKMYGCKIKLQLLIECLIYVRQRDLPFASLAPWALACITCSNTFLACSIPASLNRFILLESIAWVYMLIGFARFIS